MALFTGYISNNTDDMPDTVNPVSHVRVRIPQFHGDPNNTSGALYYTDSQLPWARVMKPDDTESFSANGYYEDGTVVLVEILNNDLTNLLITGTIGNYTYTDDPTEIVARKANLATVEGSNNQTATVSTSIVQMALSQVKTPPIHDNGRNEVKYNAWFYTGDESATDYKKLDWCCAFVCWVFYKCKLSKYLYDGNKPSQCLDLYNYHKSKGESINDNYKAGDLLFMNLNGGNNINRVEIAVTDLDKTKGTIECVGGCVWQSRNKNVVSRETRKLSQIKGAVRVGSALCTNRNDPNWKQFDSKWANEHLGPSTIKSIGCAMTSVAICMRMTGLTNQNFSPAVLNAYLSSNDGYTFGGGIRWNKTNDYIDSWKWVRNETLSGSDNKKIKRLKELMDDGYYLVISVKNNGHWVAATGYSGNKILMSDPGKSKATDLFKTYTGITRCQVFSCKNKFTMA